MRTVAVVVLLVAVACVRKNADYVPPATGGVGADDSGAPGADDAGPASDGARDDLATTIGASDLAALGDALLPDCTCADPCANDQAHLCVGYDCCLGDFVLGLCTSPSCNPRTY